MVDRVKYFQRVHSDVAHLRVAFFDAYKESIALYPNVERRRDARITVFAKCFNVSLSTEIGMSLFLTQILETKNFSRIIPGNIRDKDKRHIQDEFQQFLKMSMVNAFFASIDSSFQMLVNVADPNFSKKDKGFKTIYQYTLEKLGLQRCIPAVELLRLTRNTLHTNGYHYEKDQTVEYNGKPYKFVYGKSVDFLTWSFIAVFMYDIKEMLLAIIKSTPFANAKLIEDKFTAHEWPATLD